MYAELKMTERFHRVAGGPWPSNAKQILLLLDSGQAQYWDVSYAVQAIQKSIPPSFPLEVVLDSTEIGGFEAA